MEPLQPPWYFQYFSPCVPLRIIELSLPGRASMEFNRNLTVRANRSGASAADRRQDRRYEIQLDLNWKLIYRCRVLETGTGRTIDLSNGGIHYETERRLPAGLNVELSIAWPAMVDDLAPRQLVVSGKIVRSDGGRTAIRKCQHEFLAAGLSAH